MNQQNTLDFYANLLIQCDDTTLSEDLSPVEGPYLVAPSRGDEGEEVAVAAAALVQHNILGNAVSEGGDVGQTVQLIGEVWNEFKLIESNARLACCWLTRQKFGEYQAVDVNCESIMHALLTADASFDTTVCYSWYQRMQYLSDCLFLGVGDLCQDVFQGVRVEDIVLIEHVSIVAFEASLQAIKMWALDPNCERWHTAGDIVVLTALAVRRIPGQSEDQVLQISDSVSDSARARLYNLLASLYQRDQVLHDRLKVEADKLPNAKTLMKPLMESTEDLRFGLHLLIRLYTDFLSKDVLFEFILPLLVRQNESLLIEKWDFRNTELASNKNVMIDQVRAALACVEDSWSRRLDTFNNAERVVKLNLDAAPYLDLTELSSLMIAIASWLVKELETDSTWVNCQRAKCRKIAGELCNMIIGTLSRSAIFVQLDEDICTRLITLLARTWVVNNTQSSTTAACKSPNQSRWKVVDRDEKENDSIVWLELLSSLRHVCRGNKLIPNAGGKSRANKGPAKLLDDILNQLVCGLLRMSTFGLPIFLEQPFDDLSRKALSDRRKNAQLYYAVNTGVVKSDELVSYLELYRSFEEHIDNYSSILKTCLAGLIHLSSNTDETIYSKVLSYVSSDLGQALVFEAFANALIESINHTRLLSFGDIIQQKIPPMSELRTNRPIILGSINHGTSAEREILKVEHLLGALEMGLDTNPDYKPQPNVTELLASYMKCLKRYMIDLREIIANDNESGLDALRLIRGQLTNLSQRSVTLLGNVWLSRSVKTDLANQAVIKMSCLLCLACDWVEENTIDTPVTSPQAKESDDYEDFANSSSIAAQETSDYGSESSLKDFLDLQFQDHYRQPDISESGQVGLLECQLRPDLYHYIKNTFWDDRMAER